MKYDIHKSSVLVFQTCKRDRITHFSPLKSPNIGALDACIDAFTCTLCTQLLFRKLLLCTSFEVIYAKLASHIAENGGKNGQLSHLVEAICHDFRSSKELGIKN